MDAHRSCPKETQKWARACFCLVGAAAALDAVGAFGAVVIGGAPEFGAMPSAGKLGPKAGRKRVREKSKQARIFMIQVLSRETHCGPADGGLQGDSPMARSPLRSDLRVESGAGVQLGKGLRDTGTKGHRRNER